VQATLTKPIAEDGAALEIAIRYRRGGGAVEMEVIERGLKAPLAPPSLDLSLASGAPSGEAASSRAAGTTPARGLIPRERFCALAHGGATLAVGSPGGPEGIAPVEIAAMDGAKALIAEACP
jgi:hypothetical protein